MGIKNGLSLETCTAVLQKGSARSATTELALPKLLKGDFSVSFTLALMHKDVRLATNLGTDSATPMILANIVRDLFQTVINEHGADKDTQTLCQALRAQCRDCNRSTKINETTTCGSDLFTTNVTMARHAPEPW